MIVIDASLAAAWLLHETEAVPADRLIAVLASEPILVPAHWATEVGNALRKAVRSDRLAQSEISALLERLALLDIAIAPPPSVQTIGLLVDFALEHRLSVYDAAYLRLASERALPLATLDRSLQAAARDLGVKILPAQA